MELQSTGYRILTAVVVVLCLVVALQGILLYRMHDGLMTGEARIDTESEGKEAAQRPERRSSLRGPEESGKRSQPGRDEDFFSAYGLHPWDPMEEMMRMRERMDEIMDHSWNLFRARPDFRERMREFSFRPDMDLQEDAERYIVRMNVPGAEEGEINVRIDDRRLTVSGTIEDRTERREEDQVLRLERRQGQFSRSIALPDAVDPAGMETEYDKGVLTVIVPKADAHPRPGRRLDAI